jgi:hypothetical protein
MTDNTFVVGYVNELQDADNRVQTEVIELACQEEHLNLEKLFIASESEEYKAQTELLAAILSEPRKLVLILAVTIEVFGKTALEQARCITAILHSGAEVLLANGITIQDALRISWHNRAATELSRERSKAAMRELARKTYVLGRVPFGYSVSNRNLSINLDESEVVQMIFRLYLEGNLGLRKITRQLNDSEITTRRGNNWAVSSVRSILQNEVYTGTYHRAGTVVPSSHAAIISIEQFRSANEKMTGRRKEIDNQRSLRQTRHNYLLSGLIRCSECGSRMIGAARRDSPSGPISLLYRCSAATNQGRCNYRSQEEIDLLERIKLKIITNDFMFVDVDRRQAQDLATARARVERHDRALATTINRWAENRSTFQQAVASSGELSLESIFSRAEVLSQLDRNSSETIKVLQNTWSELSRSELKRALQTVVHHVTTGPAGIDIFMRPVEHS